MLPKLLGLSLVALDCALYRLSGEISLVVQANRLVIEIEIWATLKTEFYDRNRWVTRDAERKAVAYWIEVVYNRRRRHSALGMVSPVDFENHIGLTTSSKEIAA
ncbi:hypothetical protein HMPREF0305_12174 [Corynebacterium pseudogenitalium ATCC 33035]|uniref:Integrase catalytic domain-containing protein n=1 Tax=Corynebacterium pseudogenitalium ATCC 33035 TaxID=525264 RepID=E2S6M2_9CORY|nr:hypothetical protein HMPREF0305_12174 [Corynebacterium pseudogenitalium ATCC 33035]